MINLTDQKKLRELEAQCIQDHAPPCRAACPVHVDVRALLAAAGQGDFAGAYRILARAVPFPGVIGHVCDQPCRSVCTRGEVGEPIEIAALERACVELNPSGLEPLKRLPARGQRVAVVGAGLSGLTVAFDLARKGYDVTVFEATDRLGGSLWQVPELDLPRDVILADLAVLDTLGLDIRLNTPVSGEGALEALLETYAAVYIGTGLASAAEKAFFGGEAGHNPRTFQTSRAGVFLGGSLLRPAASRSYITAISDGRRAAISIDRYAQRVSLEASRTNEGPYTTQLYTNTEEVTPSGSVPVADPRRGYDADAAIQEARRCLQCECMECVKVCEYLAHYGGYPRRYVREIYNNLSIVMGERHANRLINSCALCGLCAEVCPTDLDMGAICAEARRVMVSQNRMPASAHEFALRDMAFSQSDQCTVVRHQPDFAASRYVFFPGCQLSGSDPQHVAAVYGYLRSTLSGGVGLWLDCCGAPAEWAGRTDLMQTSLEAFQAQYDALGSPTLVLACSTCYQVFKTHLPDVALVSLWEVFDEHGLPETRPASRVGVVSIHDPCTTRHEPQMHDSVRRIVGQLGYAIDELALSRERTTCCSYGGLMWFANHELAQNVIRRRVTENQADYVTYCAMCRDLFASQGKRTLHVLDLIFGEEQASRPGYSQRRENRARLKRTVLNALWGETVTGQEDYERLNVTMSADVLARLEERLILRSDVEQVIAYAERTGNWLLNPETGHRLAHYRPATVTYWVEYAPEESAHVVFNAYCHRMDVAEDVKP
ncbi:pyridine nucleotide-disulfide oxidoreductase/dicluster-binding protein [Aggregatilinea lenta]|uniref:pyridine nucleotide-disulfide oxidoreductase/dicluster-binding protein n=1 Tax=Aggregatilinea lenta TaxID=913108 RepID=UPI000E5A79F1|nr:pyridine nucleotide-disulfide oxidoreductase/dicluster-binding protein [Aggregatilinea lenta]